MIQGTGDRGQGKRDIETVRRFILGVAPGDPATFLGGPALLLAAVLLACWAPARRALAAQPTEALRAE
jgi:ABC-type lipoprotein release transport system permease subunit